MLTLVVITAAVLGVTLVIGLVAAVVFLVQIRRFLANTHPALALVSERTHRLAGRLEAVQGATRSAVAEIPDTRG